MTTRKQNIAMKSGLAPSVAAGECDRGHAKSLFEAVSFNRRTGEYLRTRHATAAQAAKRLAGNSRHVERHWFDHTPRKAANGSPLPSLKHVVA